MVLDKQGGPNHVKNWCIAPVLVDTSSKDVYYTPLFYVMQHFSKYIRPGAQRIHWEGKLPKDLNITAVKNTDQSIILQAVNSGKKPLPLSIDLAGQKVVHTLAPESMQTIILKRI
jgi:glucosylceramidase